MAIRIDPNSIGIFGHRAILFWGVEVWLGGGVLLEQLNAIYVTPLKSTLLASKASASLANVVIKQIFTFVAHVHVFVKKHKGTMVWVNLT